MDDALSAVSAIVEQFQLLLEPQYEEETGLLLEVDEIKLNLPVELDVELDEEGRLVAGMAPPTQQVETSFMPVFHQIKLTIARDSDGK